MFRLRTFVPTCCRRPGATGYCTVRKHMRSCRRTMTSSDDVAIGHMNGNILATSHSKLDDGHSGHTPPTKGCDYNAIRGFEHNRPRAPSSCGGNSICRFFTPPTLAVRGAAIVLTSQSANYAVKRYQTPRASRGSTLFGFESFPVDPRPRRLWTSEL